MCVSTILVFMAIMLTNQWIACFCTCCNEHLQLAHCPILIATAVEKKRPFNNLNSFVLFCSEHVFVCVCYQFNDLKLVCSNTTAFSLKTSVCLSNSLNFKHYFSLFFIAFVIAERNFPFSFVRCSHIKWHENCGCCFLFIPLGINTFNKLKKKNYTLFMESFQLIFFIRIALFCSHL